MEQLNTSRVLNASQVQRQVSRAGFKMNGYARVYFDALPESEHLYGERGLKTQVLYFFCNCKAMTPEQKEVKRSLSRWAKGGKR